MSETEASNRVMGEESERLRQRIMKSETEARNRRGGDVTHSDQRQASNRDMSKRSTRSAADMYVCLCLWSVSETEAEAEARDRQGIESCLSARLGVLLIYMYMSETEARDRGKE